MKLLGSSSILTTVAVALTATFFVGAACGKDKPAEEAPTEAPAEGAPVEDEGGSEPGDEASDKPAEGEAKPGEDAGGSTDEARTRADPKEVADDPKARLRAARDRPGRRPAPVRSLRDGTERPPRGEGEPGFEPGLGEAGEPTPNPSQPEPVIAPEDPSAAPTEPTPAEPAPTEAPAGGYEIRNDAAAIDAAKMMPLVAVTEILGKQLAAGVPLQGIALVAGYGSIFYASPEATKFGVALQAWQDPTRRESEDRFRRMRLQYPNAEDISALLPSKGFYAYFGGVQSLTWSEPTKRMVLSVTCAEGLCSHDQLVRLAKSTRERM